MVKYNLTLVVVNLFSSVVYISGFPAWVAVKIMIHFQRCDLSYFKIQDIERSNAPTSNRISEEKIDVEKWVGKCWELPEIFHN